MYTICARFLRWIVRPLQAAGCPRTHRDNEHRGGGDMATVGDYVRGVRDDLVERFGMQEVHGADDGPWLSLGAQAPIGEARRYHGQDVARIVNVGVDLPDGSLAAHMLVVQAPATSALPHLAIDLMKFPNGFGFFVDLLPRVDLSAHVAYVDEVYAVLDKPFEVLESTPGLVQVPMPPRMLAFYSPWMLHKFECPDLDLLTETIDAFVTQFVALATDGIRAPELPSGDELATRDQRHRDVLFDPTFDPVWQQVTPLLGADAVTTIRETLGSPLT